MSVTTPDVADRIGATYRQLDYWIRRGYVEGMDAFACPGTGYNRTWQAQSLASAERLARLVRAGFVTEVAASLAAEGDGTHDVAPGVTVTIGAPARHPGAFCPEASVNAVLDWQGWPS